MKTKPKNKPTLTKREAVAVHKAVRLMPWIPSADYRVIRSAIRKLERMAEAK